MLTVALVAAWLLLGSALLTLCRIAAIADAASQDEPFLTVERQRAARTRANPPPSWRQQ